MSHDRIAVVDFGGQYAHLIATKIRRLRVLAEILQPEDPVERFAEYKGIVLSGSPSLSSFGEDSAYTKAIYDLPTPIIGFCFGHQEIAKHYGGQVVHGGREWGHADLHLARKHPLFTGLSPVEQVWMSHYDSVVAVGPEFEELGYTTTGAHTRPDGPALQRTGDERGGWRGGRSPDRAPAAPSTGGREPQHDTPHVREVCGDGWAQPRLTAHRYAAIGSDRLRRYGFQFHPEVDDTAHGDEMIANFVFEICGCRPSWTMERYVEEEIAKIKRQVGDGAVFLLASGGVDSTVAAKLLAQALGPQRVHLLHIDNGLMRKDESRKVLATFASLGLDKHLAFVDASDTFLRALDGIVEPEKKRRVIGDTFVEVFEREARRLGIEHYLLAQGTIYPDTIETGGTKRADTIKTHHNRVPIINEMIAAGRVVEPLAELYKVEVRELGERLGVRRELVWRHPFPGPGLGVRLLCSNGQEDREGFDRIEPAVAEASALNGLAMLALPIRSVGVKADLRAYEHPVMISGEASWERLLHVAGNVYKTVPGINRCLWNLDREAPARVRPLAATVTRARLDLLREADAIVMDGLRRHGIYDEIWQCPTVLVPLEIDGRGRELVIVRPIHSERAMTATPARLPSALVDELRVEILALPGVSGLAYDLTTKPPGTIEWE